MLTRREFIKLMLASGATTYVMTRKGLVQVGRAAQSSQIPMVASTIPQFVDPLPNLLSADHLIVDNGTPIELTMREQRVPMLPAGAVPDYAGTRVWSYLQAGQSNLDTYLGPVIIATRNQPTEIKFINELGNTSGAMDAYKYATDQTLHWADPFMYMYAHLAGYPDPGDPRSLNYGEGMLGGAPIPAVPHLHGGEVPPVLDGGPDAWFTSDGTMVGSSYYSKGNDLTPKNYCIYRYPNCMEGALIWFHDHTLGATRLNVYMGLAGGYLLADPSDPIHATLPELVPLVVQDRMFDTNGQLFFPAATMGGVLWALNPEHPYWVPEFIGDVICVNGKTWPYMDVQQKRYTFLFVEGSNARGYEISLVDPVSKNVGPALWVVGTDGGYLDVPAKIAPNNLTNSKLVMLPGERYWVIVDFAGYGAGTVGPNGSPYSGKWLLKNTAKVPYPGGSTPNGTTTGRIMQFRVQGPPVSDGTYNPASGAPLRQPMIRLTSAPVQKTRQLTLNEIMGMPRTVTDPVTGNLTAFPGGPIEILVNNTKWGGKYITGIGEDNMFTFAERPDFVWDQHHINMLSEVPKEGETELWEVINTTEDAHPIHLHLAQFQLLNRQAFDTKKYFDAYSDAFPAGYDFTMDMDVGPGEFIPAFGPPLNYNTGVTGKLGGNPDVTPYLKGPAKPALPQESGWKDTVVMLPGQVTRILVRWAPTNLAANTAPANANYTFDPRAFGGGYVWHCHIVDHEDNEMMRPDEVEPNAGVSRSYDPANGDY